MCTHLKLITKYDNVLYTSMSIIENVSIAVLLRKENPHCVADLGLFIKNLLCK